MNCTDSTMPRRSFSTNVATERKALTRGLRGGASTRVWETMCPPPLLELIPRGPGLDPRGFQLFAGASVRDTLTGADRREASRALGVDRDGHLHATGAGVRHSDALLVEGRRVDVRGQAHAVVDRVEVDHVLRQLREGASRVHHELQRGRPGRPGAGAR